MKYYECSFPNSSRKYTYHYDGGDEFNAGDLVDVPSREGGEAVVEIQRETFKPAFETKAILRLATIGGLREVEPIELPAQVGHNNPPEDEGLSETLAAKELAYIADLHKLAQREHLDLRQIDDGNDEAASAFTSAIKDITRIIKDVDSDHKTLKAPFLESGRKCDEWKKQVIERAEKAKAPLVATLSDFLTRKENAERQRLLEAQERAEREALEKAALAKAEAEALAKEAQDNTASGLSEMGSELMSAAIMKQHEAELLERHVANAKPSELAKTRHATTGASASHSETWVGEIDDMRTIDLEALRNYIAKDAVQIALNKYVKDGGRQLRGAKIALQTKLKVR